jgi:hypothetical protein
MEPIAGLAPNFAFLWKVNKWTVSGESWTLFHLPISVSPRNSCLEAVLIRLAADIRQTCAIYSKQHGAIHLVPREGKIVRLYIHLTDFKSGQERFNRSSITQQDLLEAARKVLSPYKLDYRTCDWWSIYQVGVATARRKIPLLISLGWSKSSAQVWCHGQVRQTAKVLQ